jgi:hypothetical protein
MTQLLHKLAEATQKHYEIVNELASFAAINHPNDGFVFSRLLECAKEQRENCQRARNELKHHLAEHRCWGLAARKPRAGQEREAGLELLP